MFTYTTTVFAATEPLIPQEPLRELTPKQEILKLLQLHGKRAIVALKLNELLEKITKSNGYSSEKKEEMVTWQKEFFQKYLNDFKTYEEQDNASLALCYLFHEIISVNNHLNDNSLEIQLYEMICFENELKEILKITCPEEMDVEDLLEDYQENDILDGDLYTLSKEIDDFFQRQKELDLLYACRCEKEINDIMNAANLWVIKVIREKNEAANKIYKVFSGFMSHIHQFQLEVLESKNQLKNLIEKLENNKADAKQEIELLVQLHIEVLQSGNQLKILVERLDPNNADLVVPLHEKKAVVGSKLNELLQKIRESGYYSSDKQQLIIEWQNEFFSDYLNDLQSFEEQDNASLALCYFLYDILFVDDKSNKNIFKKELIEILKMTCPQEIEVADFIKDYLLSKEIDDFFQQQRELICSHALACETKINDHLNAINLRLIKTLDDKKAAGAMVNKIFGGLMGNISQHQEEILQSGNKLKELVRGVENNRAEFLQILNNSEKIIKKGI